MYQFFRDYFQTNLSKDQSRDTGMAMVLICLILGFISHTTIYFKIAIPILIINMIIPNLYKPIAFLWNGFSHLLGTIVSKVILTLIFFVIVTPIGLFRRLLGFDNLKLNRFKNGNNSVMEIRNITFSRRDIENPF